MSSRKPAPTSADYLVIAISPALIMLLVGSLIFFLLTAFYQSEFEGRLKYISALFVFSAVLITRISIVEGAERAAVLSVPLAIATWVTLAKFTVAGIFIVPLVIAITWFAAHKLTWSCTLIDDQVNDPGGGLAQAIGFENDEVPEGGSSARSGPEAEAGEIGEKKAKENSSPGLWVLYFGVLTLPLFGLGQLVMPDEDIVSRQAAFGYLVTYVAAALGLLGTTSFLSLRRYLRQRRLTMPADMATAWPMSVAVIILGVLLLCSLLPRPRPAYSVTNWVDSVSGRSKKANRLSVLKDNEVKSEELQGDVPQDSDEESDQSETAEGESKKQSSRDSKNGQKKSDSSESDSKENSDSEPTEKSESEPQEDSGNQESEKRSETSQEATDDTQESDTQNWNEQDAEDQASKDGENSTSPAKSTPPANSIQDTIRRLTPSFQGIGDILRWIYRLAFAIGLLYLFLRHARAIMAAIGRFIQDLLSFFQKEPAERAAEEEAASSDPVKIRKPFAAYRNPFGGKSMNDVDLVRHSFLALEAWAHENGIERSEDETPQEFAQRIGRKFPRLGSPSQYLIQLYDRLAYRGRLPSLQVEKIRNLWALLG